MQQELEHLRHEGQTLKRGLDSVNSQLQASEAQHKFTAGALNSVIKAISQVFRGRNGTANTGAPLTVSLLEMATGIEGEATERRPKRARIDVGSPSEGSDSAQPYSPDPVSEMSPVGLQLTTVSSPSPLTLNSNVDVNSFLKMIESPHAEDSPRSLSGSFSPKPVAMSRSNSRIDVNALLASIESHPDIMSSLNQVTSDPHPDQALHQERVDASLMSQGQQPETAPYLLLNNSCTN